MNQHVMPESTNVFVLRKRFKALRALAAAELKGVRQPPAQPSQRLVFTVSNGRSGTNMLASVLTAVRDATALHEPAPDFRHLRSRVVRMPALGRAWLRHVKLPAIAALPGSVYFETSHMFCKGYLEPMQDLGQPFDLMILSRPARDIAKSMANLPAIPGETLWARSYYVAPDEPNMLPPGDEEQLSRYQICYWHALENERRQAHYEAVMTKVGARVAHIQTDELSSREAVLRLLDDLAIDRANVDEAALSERLGERVNLKAHEKREGGFDAARLDEEEAEVRERLAAFTAEEAPRLAKAS